MNLILEKLREKLPHLNEKIYTETDFYRICRKEKVKVFEIPLRVHIHGYYSNYRGRSYIILNSRITEAEKLETAFHELGHHYLHAPVAQSVFFDSQSLSNRQEIEAQAFALLALIPLPLLRQFEENPSLLDDYPPELVGQRLKLFEICGV